LFALPAICTPAEKWLAIICHDDWHFVVCQAKLLQNFPMELFQELAGKKARRVRAALPGFKG
jgi:hypothetical protein